MNLKNMSQKKLKKSGGFTLVEMLIVVAIIVILVVVSIPMISGSLDEARQATDAANERAAKSAALIEYMMDPPDTESASYYYVYNADTGAATSASPGSPTVTGVNGYNQVVDAGSGRTAKNSSVVVVTITVSAGTTTADTGWVAISGGS